MANYDILIIGGGVIGLSLAREFHRLGVRRIAVVERGKAGREASFAAAGMLAPNAENEVIDDFYRFCDGSRKLFPGFSEGLLAETDLDIELDRSGTLYTAYTEADTEHLGLRYSRQQTAGIPVERLTRSETLAAEPALAETVRESLFFPNDWQVENRNLLAALIRSAALNGISILEESQVDSLIAEGSRVTGAVVGNERIAAGTTILATGAWTSFIKIGGAEAAIHIKPIKGQMISFGPAEHILKRVIYSPRGYLVPRADGRVLAGATVEDAGFDVKMTDGSVGQLRAAAAEMAPALGRLDIADKWAGLRPFAADGLPVIGPIPGYSDVFAATAHFRNGILLAPLTAKVLAESIIVGTASRYLDLFSPARLMPAGSDASA